MHCLCPEGATGPARVLGASTALERRAPVDRILDLQFRFAVMLSGGGKPDFRRRGAIRAGKEVPMDDHELYLFADLVLPDLDALRPDLEERS